MIFQNQVPLLTFFPALSHCSIRNDHFTGIAVIYYWFPISMHFLRAEIAGTQETPCLICIFVLFYNEYKRHIRILFSIIPKHWLLAWLISLIPNNIRPC